MDTRASLLARVLKKYSPHFFDVLREAGKEHEHIRRFTDRLDQVNWPNITTEILPSLLFHLLVRLQRKGFAPGFLRLVHLIERGINIPQMVLHGRIRLLGQFDSSNHRLLTDVLGSYEFVPGTVMYAGYGSIYEQRAFLNGELVPNTGNYLTVNRGLFFKASYLHRF